MPKDFYISNGKKKITAMFLRDDTGFYRDIFKDIYPDFSLIIVTGQTAQRIEAETCVLNV